MQVVVLVGVWWAVTEGRPGSWALGAPVVAATLVLWKVLRPAGAASTLRPLRLFRFVPYFLWQSALGGADVAVRALHRRLPLGPVLLRHVLTLRSDPARAFFAGAASLLPGSTAVELDGPAATIHVLTDDPGRAGDLQRLEHEVARLFGDPGPWNPSRGSGSSHAAPGESGGG